MYPSLPALSSPADKDRRMGRDKALIELGGLPMLLRTARLVQSVVGLPILVGRATAYRALGIRAIEDDWPGSGPLGGIATALRASATTWTLIVACDLPYLTKPWLDFLVARALASEGDAVLPMNVLAPSRSAPCIINVCEPVIRVALERGRRKVTDGLAGLLSTQFNRLSGKLLIARVSYSRI